MSTTLCSLIFCKSTFFGTFLGLKLGLTSYCLFDTLHEIIFMEDTMNKENPREGLKEHLAYFKGRPREIGSQKKFFLNRQRVEVLKHEFNKENENGPSNYHLANFCDLDHQYFFEGKPADERQDSIIRANQIEGHKNALHYGRYNFKRSIAGYDKLKGIRNHMVTKNGIDERIERKYGDSPKAESLKHKNEQRIDARVADEEAKFLDRIKRDYEKN